MKRSPKLLQILSGIVLYEAGAEVDADGSPMAYGPNNSGLDWTSNAGSPGAWYGIAINENDAPFIQGPNDPYPGFYISTTALQDHTKNINDTARYVDAEKINYISVAGDLIQRFGIHMGDIAAVYYRNTNTLCGAICADIGPKYKYSEISMSLASQLGMDNSPRHGGCGDNVITLIFVNSHSAWPLTNDIILELAKSLLQQVGGISQFY